MKTLCCVSAMLVGLAGSGISWAQTPEGPDFLVNTDLVSPLGFNGAIASAADGRFVVVWSAFSPPDASNAIFARRYDVTGAAAGPAFRVNAITGNIPGFPAVAATPDGRFVVAWMKYGTDGSRDDIVGQRFDASGNRVGLEFRVNTYTTGRQLFPSVAAAADGRFVVAWFTWMPGIVVDVAAQRYDADGVPQGGEFLVNVTTTGNQEEPAVAMAADGAFVVTWMGRGPDDDVGVFARRYDAAGTPLGSEFRVNAYTTGYQSVPSVSAAPDGRFVVAWGSNDGVEADVFARRYDAAGSPQGDEFRLNSHTTDAQSRPSVSAAADGSFAAAWISRGQATSSPDIFARRFDARGNPEGPELQVNTTVTIYTQRSPGVAAAANTRFVVAWDNKRQDLLFGRRYFPRDLIFADGFESGDLSAWSLTGGDIAVSPGAALKSTALGLEGAAQDRAGFVVQDDSPVDENRYRARFYFDTNGFDPGETLNHHRTRLLVAFEENPTQRLAQIMLRRLGGSYAILARIRLDDGTRYDTGGFPITAGEHFVEFDWKRASGPDALDGAFELWIDGAPVHAVTTLDNSLRAVDFVRLGAISVKTGANGTLLYDEFESRRQTYIGP